MSNIAVTDVPIQIESIQTGAPTSEAALAAMGGAINYCLTNIAPVGSVMTSFLDESTYQSQVGTGWILCDGRSVVGSQYQSLTGHTNVPDMRGLYPRMKNNGSSNDTHGELALGAGYQDQNNSHVHAAGGLQVKAVQFGSGGSQSFNVVLYGSGGTSTIMDIGSSVQNSSATPTPTGTTTTGTEVNPKTVVVNFFVRIN